jgi:hypothetical protein
VTNAGDIAGSISKTTGYRQIQINKKCYKEHRLAWLYVHGTLPTNHIDHINGNKHDNRIDNLREATHSENHQNRCTQHNNTSGFTGVVWHKRENKWQSRISIDGVRVQLGYFNTPYEAHLAYLKAKAELHTFNPTPR